MADSLAPGVTTPAPLNQPQSATSYIDGSTFSPLTAAKCFSPGWLPLDAGGYRTATNGKGGKSKAHRLTYRLFIGPIPVGALVFHHCGNPACINPHHLYTGSTLQNARNKRMTKLTNADVLAILASPQRVTDLALKYSVSKSCISRIRTGHARTNALQTASAPTQASAQATTSGRA